MDAANRSGMGCMATFAFAFLVQFNFIKIWHVYIFASAFNNQKRIKKMGNKERDYECMSVKFKYTKLFLK